MATKYYAIKRGYNKQKDEEVLDIIVSTWAECQKYVKGVKGAKYKSFTSSKEAKEYLANNSSINKEELQNLDEYMHIYVDGSYNAATNKYSYGLVVLDKGIIVHIEGKAFDCSFDKNIRQIAGELKAAICGMEYASNNNIKKVAIFHDYVGICNHATGEWSRKEQSSIDYYNKMQSFINSGIEVFFVKVNSHTGDLYNEMADEICKNLLEIPSDNVVSKYLKNNKINVIDNNIKDELIKIAKEASESIIVCNKKYNEESSFRQIQKEYNNSKDSAMKLVLDLPSIKKVELIQYLLEKNK